MLLTNLILPGCGAEDKFDIQISDATNKITTIQPTSHAHLTDPPSRVIPTLCHPHVHLDKPFLLTSHNTGTDLPNYIDLAPQDGSFSEALANTSKAKERYTHADLIRRGSQLIAESIQAGVTSMRAFVEIDHVTRFKCVEAGIELKRKFAEQCYVQLCAFAQDPVFNAEKHGEENRQLVEEALEKFKGEVEVLGSTPYVEGSEELQKKNVEWATRTAVEHQLHLDFHLDYTLDRKSEPIVWHVVQALKGQKWTQKAKGKKVVVGHCTRLTLFTTDEMTTLAKQIKDAELPISFVGLPTSDLFMMGRPSEDDWGGSRPKGTLPVLELINRFKLNACIGINNVGNAFTPWGSVDPLRLASLCVGVYQAGTPRDAELLFECISALAQSAIGLDDLVVRSLKDGADALFLVISNDKMINIIGQNPCIPARQRVSVADMVWDPPELQQRRVIGKVRKS
ncbi:hypothetical protein H2198_010388 [Neophaeococcomyces mojaviensis]|uniref:Uncharacterized protein n=1 Tax=Neophaeococcomyces mojaviensis TaxID=3383035 RepID=A0ACC2ZRU7_9EURO|nr:hypothetical protein H2198_010388 [Knufia sp. JES_112]